MYVALCSNIHDKTCNLAFEPYSVSCRSKVFNGEAKEISSIKAKNQYFVKSCFLTQIAMKLSEAPHIFSKYNFEQFLFRKLDKSL